MTTALVHIPSEREHRFSCFLLHKNIIEERFVILLVIFDKEATKCREEEWTQE